LKKDKTFFSWTYLEKKKVWTKI